MASTHGRFVNPTQDTSDTFPYRRVWISLTSETAAVVVVALAIYAATNLLGMRVPAALQNAASLLIVSLPVGFWLAFSVLPERAVQLPRIGLIQTAAVSGLVASGLALPFLENTLQPQSWLPFESAINRVLGYTLTLGIVQEASKYLVLRYMVWSELMRIRLDAVAYAAAAALGFSFVQNMAFITATPSPAVAIVGIRVAETLILNLSASLIVSIGFAELRFSQPSPFFMTLNVALAALIVGIGHTLISGLSNATFAERGTFSRPLLGFGFAVALFVITVAVSVFLYNTVERRDREVRRLTELG